MTTRTAISVLSLILVSCGAEPPPAEDAPAAKPPELTEAQRSQIAEALGKEGTFYPEENVYKVTFPRDEVAVQVDGGDLPPFMGVTSWASFTPTSGSEVMVMGDLALFQDEVNPVLAVLVDQGLAVTALHNHFFYDRPRVMFMHIGGQGDAAALARGVRGALDRTAEIRTSFPRPALEFLGQTRPAADAIDPALIDVILGVRGTLNGGKYKVVWGRTAETHGVQVGKQMGVNTWAAFGGTDENAYVDGDFAMREDELQAVLKALRKADLKVVAIHNHMTGEAPRYVFLHYWGRGPSTELARGVKAGLDALGAERQM